jgi:hypothetical protein
MRPLVPRYSDINIFLSVGHGLSDAQERFVSSIRAVVEEQGAGLATLGRPIELAENPLLTVRDLLTNTSGTLVIAFARLRIHSAVEYPDSDHEMRVAGWNLATAWNQVEAAMSFQARRPVLILHQEGLHQEGIIDEDLCARLYDRSAIQLARFPNVGPLFQSSVAVENAVAQWTCDLIRKNSATAPPAS